jgi:hypothetical protein
MERKKEGKKDPIFPHLYFSGFGPVRARIYPRSGQCGRRDCDALEMDPLHGRGGAGVSSRQPQMEEIQYFRLPSGATPHK